MATAVPAATPMDTSADTLTQQSPNRPYSIRTCSSLRNPTQYQQSRVSARAATAVVPWDQAITQYCQAPFGDQNSPESVEWQSTFAETLFRCLVTQDEFDRGVTATRLKVADDNPLLDVCAAFHAEITTFHDVISDEDGFWREACQHEPFSGPYSGVCLHAIVRSELQWDTYHSDQVGLTAQPGDPSDDTSTTDRLHHSTACNITLRENEGSDARIVDGRGYRVPRFLEPETPLTDHCLYCPKYPTPVQFEPLFVDAVDGVHMWAYAQTYTPYTAIGDRLVRVRGTAGNTASRYCYRDNSPVMSASDLNLRQTYETHMADARATVAAQASTIASLQAQLAAFGVGAAPQPAAPQPAPPQLVPPQQAQPQQALFGNIPPLGHAAQPPLAGISLPAAAPPTQGSKKKQKTAHPRPQVQVPFQLLPAGATHTFEVDGSFHTATVQQHGTLHLPNAEYHGATQDVRDYITSWNRIASTRKQAAQAAATLAQMGPPQQPALAPNAQPPPGNQPGPQPNPGRGRGRGYGVSSYPPVAPDSHDTDAYATPSWPISHADMEAYVAALNTTPFIAQTNAATAACTHDPAHHADGPPPPPILLSAAAHGQDYTQSLTMMLPVHVERGRASRKKRRTQLTALADTGSTHTFISDRYASHVKLNGAQGRVKLADSAGHALCKFGILTIVLDGYVHEHTVGVMDLNPQFDMILGQDWMLTHRAVLSYDPGSTAVDERCIRFKDPATDRQHVAQLSQHHKASMLNSVIYNTIADVRQKVASGENEQDSNPVTHMFMVQVSRVVDDILADNLGYMPAVHAMQHDASMPHTHQNDYESYDQFDEPDAEVQVETASLKDEMQGLVREFKDRFPSDIPTGLPPDRGSMYHCIPLKPGEQPSFKKAYRLTPAEKLEVEAKVRDLLEKGWIEPAHSPYGAPILFVGKKDGGLRMCVDYRAFNDKTIKNKYPLPRIDDLLDELHGAQFFSSLDLQQAYHQLRLKPEDIEKYAFNTHLGQFQYKVLSFGLTNAPATFQSVMNTLLREHLGKYCLVYLDDVLIYSKTAGEHVQHLRAVLQTLREAQFTVS